MDGRIAGGKPLIDEFRDKKAEKGEIAAWIITVVVALSITAFMMMALTFFIWATVEMWRSI